MFKPPTASDAPFDPDAWHGTTRDQWTIRDVYFDTAGWRLSESTDTRMSWVGAFGGTMTLTRDDVPAWTGVEIDLDAVRRRHRSAAAERHGGLVSAEVVEMANGAVALEVLTKYPRGTGYRFEGRLLIDERPLAYAIVLGVDETKTGVRETIVNGLRMQLGELNFFDLMAGPVDPKTGGRTVPGMKLDPYDPSYDEEATYSASDDPRLDDLLQTHPLAVIRSSLYRAQLTWECALRPPTPPSSRPSLPDSSGPIVILSEAFFRELHAMVKNQK